MFLCYELTDVCLSELRISQTFDFDINEERETETDTEACVWQQIGRLVICGGSMLVRCCPYAPQSVLCPWCSGRAITVQQFTSVICSSRAESKQPAVFRLYSPSCVLCGTARFSTWLTVSGKNRGSSSLCSWTESRWQDGHPKFTLMKENSAPSLKAACQKKQFVWI